MIKIKLLLLCTLLSILSCNLATETDTDTIDIVAGTSNISGRISSPVAQKKDSIKGFNLNDPQYLHTFMFSEFQDSILKNEALGLPVIGESDIPSWLASVKGLLADLIGFDEGSYYDILAANAYGRQLTEQREPLSDRQKEHIADYWKNGEIAKILFRKNQQIIKLDRAR